MFPQMNIVNEIFISSKKMKRNKSQALEWSYFRFFSDFFSIFFPIFFPIFSDFFSDFFPIFFRFFFRFFSDFFFDFFFFPKNFNFFFTFFHFSFFLFIFFTRNKNFIYNIHLGEHTEQLCFWVFTPLLVVYSIAETVFCKLKFLEKKN